MIDIPTGVKWTGFRETVSGTGTTSVSGEVLTATSVAGSTARRSKLVKLSPGSIITMSCMARLVSGSPADAGGLAIDWPISGTNVNRVRVASTDWEEYSISFACPLEAGDNDYALVSFGVFTADIGTCEFAYPSVKISNSPFGAARVHAYGLIRMNAGAPTINSGFVTAGIVGMTYNAGTKKLTITTSPALNRTSANASPLMLATMTPDPGTSSAALKLAARAGNFDDVAGTFDVAFVDTTTGLLVDVTATGSFYFSLMLVI